MRLDLALFQLRLYPSRSRAAAAIESGQVRLSGRTSPLKPSDALRAGDLLTLSGPSGPRSVEVLELPRASLSRAQAKALVRDVDDA